MSQGDEDFCNGRLEDVAEVWEWRGCFTCLCQDSKCIYLLKESGRWCGGHGDGRFKLHWLLVLVKVKKRVWNVFRVLQEGTKVREGQTDGKEMESGEKTVTLLSHGMAIPKLSLSMACTIL